LIFHFSDPSDGASTEIDDLSDGMSVEMDDPLDGSSTEMDNEEVLDLLLAN
jgi:hypothetical protein